MATLAGGGRISVADVDRERARLERSWSAAPASASDIALGDLLEPSQLEAIDLFDRMQLIEVVRVCRASATISEAGRTLFQVSRTRRAAVNDADRLRKYLARFSLDWERVHGRVAGGGVSR
jgi:transcriptional regulatory protein RtcR